MRISKEAKINTDIKSYANVYQRMIDEISDYAIILLNRNGIIENWNKGAEKIKGYRAEEIIGKSFRIFYSQEDQQSKLPETLLNQALTEGRVSHEGWRIRKDGTKFWGSVVITAIHDESYHVIGFTKVTRDLTRKKLDDDEQHAIAERIKKQNEELEELVQKLRESEERYHKMISEVTDYAIILLSTTGDILNWNKGAEKIKGYSEKEIVGKSFRTFYSKEDRENNLPDKLLAEAKAKGRSAHEGWRLRKDGTRFWGSVVITSLHDHDGKIIGFSKVTRDLTERKLYEDQQAQYAQQLEEKNVDLERMNQELTSFAYVSSHDLQEPLRKIQTFITRIAETEVERLSEKGNDYFKRIQNAAARMQTLIEDLLAYSRTNTDERKSEDVDLNVLVDEVKSDLKEKIDEKNGTVRVGKLPTVNVINFQFHQLFTNLIGNSLKFSKIDTPPVINIDYGEIDGRNIVNGRRHDDVKYHHITVRDNGIGFEPEYNAKIFEIFQRLHGRSEYSGTGIGLAICKKIVENHGGIIQAEGTPNVGAAFHIYLPVQ